MSRNKLLSLLEKRFKGKVIIEHVKPLQCGKQIIYQIFLFRTLAEAFERDETGKLTWYICERLKRRLKNVNIEQGTKSIYVYILISRE